MRRFACGEVIPGCPEVITGADDSSVLAQVIAHAAKDHGLLHPPAALVELVQASTATVPSGRSHLRVVEGSGATPDAVPVQEDSDPSAVTQRQGLPRLLDASRIEGTVTDLTDRIARNHGRGARLAQSFGVGRSAHDHTTYRHEALLYRGTDEFLALIVPFIRDGLEREQPVMVAVSEPRLQAVRSELGPDVASTLFADMAELGANPARIIPAWREFADRYGMQERPIRGVGEPIWAGRRAPEIAECQLHEALLNLALSPDTPLWLICPYDLDALESDVIDEAHRSHPAILDAEAYRGSTEYGGTYHVESLFRRPLPEPSSPTTTIAVSAARRSFLTEQVTAYAEGAGLPPERVVRLATAVDEVAMAVVREAAGEGRVRFWQDGTAVVCEVRDAGVVDDPLIGRAPTLRPGTREHGLRLANKLADLVQIRSNAAGTATRVHSWL